MSARRRWVDLRRCAREKVAHYTPNILVEFPFEVMVSFLAFINGVPLLTGLARPESLALLLPTFAYLAYGVALVLGAVTVAVSLRRAHAAGLASGLQLLGGSFVVYGLAVVAAAGWENAWVAFTIAVGVGALAVLRSIHFRRIIDIQIGARRLSRRS